MSGLYVLDGHMPVVEEDVLAWGRWFETANDERRVDETSVGDVRISTVFLGADYNFTPGGLPLVFETMVFGGPHEGYTDRYTTWDEAEAGHARIVAALRAGKDPDDDIEIPY